MCSQDINIENVEVAAQSKWVTSVEEAKERNYIIPLTRLCKILDLDYNEYAPYLKDGETCISLHELLVRAALPLP